MKRFGILLLFLMVPSWVEAGTKTPFDLSPVNFWEEKKVHNETAVPSPTTMVKTEDPMLVAPSENLWTEPMVTPDGKITIYTPPKEVKSFLDNPTEETGKAYLDWSMKRLDKITKAGDILQILTQQLMDNKFDYGKTYSPDVDLKNVKYMAFFLLKGCPYCTQQIKNIGKLKERRSDLNIDVFVKNYTHEDLAQLPFTAKPNNDLSDSLGFNKFPTTLVEDNQGKKSLIPGVLSEDILNLVLK